jgi:hypothetical protein
MGDFNANKKEIDVASIIFIILLVIVLICLLPFYSSIFTLFRLSFNAEVGTDVYVSMLGFIFSLVIMGIGFRNRNALTKIFALVLASVFIINPFTGYFGKQALFKKTLKNYNFKGMSVVQSSECGMQAQAQDQLITALKKEYGDGFDVEVETPTIDKNSTFKEKFQCMPSETTFMYSFTYKDAYGKKRKISYTSDDVYYQLLKIASYEIVNEEITKLLKNNQGTRKISYNFYILDSKSKLIDMTRNSINAESIYLDYPSTITLKKYNEDKKIVLEIKMSDISKIAEAHSIIKELKDISEHPINVIINYAKETEYYIQDELVQVANKEEYSKLLKAKIRE